MGCAADVHEKLLKGEQPDPAQLALADRRRPQFPALFDVDMEEDSVGGGVDPNALEYDMADSTPSAEDDANAGATLVEDAGSASVGEESRPPPASPPASPEAIPELEPFTWGVFTVGVKHPTATNLGGYEARCKFHARNKNTGCKKLIALESPDACGLALARSRAKWWCAQAKDVTRQRMHLYDADLLSPPEEDVLAAMIIEDGPTEPVVNDEDFYKSNKAEHSKGQGKRRRICGKTKAGQTQMSSQAASSVLSAPGPATQSDGESSSSSGENDDKSNGSSGSNNDKSNSDSDRSGNAGSNRCSSSDSSGDGSSNSEPS